MTGAIVVMVHARCDGCQQPMRWTPEDFEGLGSLEMLSLEEINKRSIQQGIVFGDDDTAWHIVCKQ